MTPLVEAVGLTKVFRLRGPAARERKETRFVAVDDVSLSLAGGETLALVGESGSGKTTVGKMLVRIERPTSGSILHDGVDLLKLRGSGLRKARRDFQMVFQDPYESLDPRCTVGQSVEEPLRALTELNAADRRDRVQDILDRVGLAPGRDTYHRYPHELSGGQRQRAAIARALVVLPTFVVCDEPVSMLDVSIRAGVLELLKDLQRDTGVAILFVTHDLAVARYMAKNIAVMYRGRVVETGPRADVISNPRHPYTQLLLASVPRIEEPEGHVAETPAIPDAPTSGCGFAPRCPLAQQRCLIEAPVLRTTGDGHAAACHFA